jgi:hypothetical protein
MSWRPSFSWAPRSRSDARITQSTPKLHARSRYLALQASSSVQTLKASSRIRALDPNPSTPARKPRPIHSTRPRLLLLSASRPRSWTSRKGRRCCWGSGTAATQHRRKCSCSGRYAGQTATVLVSGHTSWSHMCSLARSSREGAFEAREADGFDDDFGRDDLEKQLSSSWLSTDSHATACN